MPLTIILGSLAAYKFYTDIKKTNLEKVVTISAKKAESFLLENRVDNLWKDFHTNTHAESIDWVTSYVGNIILESNKTLLDELKPAALKIAKRQNTNGGWGYNKNIAPDTDSTSFSVLFLSHYRRIFEREICRGVEFLLKHQKESGGFSTYNKDEIIQYNRLNNLSVEGGAKNCLRLQPQLL